MAQLIALFLTVFGLLPLANWIPGGHSAAWYPERLRLWLSGGAIVLGIACIAGIVARRYPARWPVGGWTWLAARWRAANRLIDGAIACAAGLLYAAVSQVVLSAKPLLIDEVIQLYQARLFASGRLWAVASAHPEFTSSMHLLDWGGKVYGQFPAGGPAMLAIGTLLHAEWLVGPITAALGVYAFARLLRMIEARDGVALAAVLLLAFAPFSVFLDASMMNHVTATTWLLVAALALAHATAPAVPRAAGDRSAAHRSAAQTTAARSTAATAVRAGPWAALLGLCLGIAATIRPLDAASFAIPAAAWLGWRALRGGAPELKALLLSGVGVAIPLVVLLLVNKSQTGNPFEFGYIAMWGKSHELGFHEAPWGFPHTPARGLELVNLYLLRLQTYFLETPAPALLFATGALALSRKLTAFDRWMLAGSSLLLLSYFAYWHDGFYLGPRFMLPLVPWLALWTARFPALLRERGASLPVQQGVVAGSITALLMGATMLLPLRAEQYRNGMLSMRFDVDALAEQASVRGAIVFARESWGAQLVVRMWALGVSRVDAERIYRKSDACKLDGLITTVERSRGNAADFLHGVEAFAGDSARLVRLRNAPDSTWGILPGALLAPRCVRRIIEDRDGFTAFAPLLLAGKHGNTYVRELHALDSVLITTTPGRSLYLLTQDPVVGGALRFRRFALDSARAAWALDAREAP